MELLSLFAKIGIDDKEYNKGIEGAESKAGKLAKGMKTAFKVGAAAVGVTAAAVAGVSKAFVGAAKETAAYGDNVDKMSQKIGISVEAYQKWDYVMQRAGGNVDSLKMGMKTLSQQADKNSNAFQKLGISQEEVASLSQEELFEKTVKGLSAMEAGTERTTLATQLFGRAGADMGPLLNQGSDAIAEQMEIAEKYGMVMSDKTVKASAEFTDSMTTLSMTAEGLKNRLMGEFLPALTEVTDGLALVFTGNYAEGSEKISSGIENLLTGVVDKLPTILDIGSNVILTIADSIITNLPKIADTAITVIMKLGNGLIKELPTLLTVGLQILLSLVNGITQNLPTLIPAIVSVITEIATTLTEPNMLTQLITVALDLILALADGLVKAIPQLISVLPTIVENLVTTLIKLAPKLLTAAGKLIKTLANGIIASKTEAGKAIGKIFDHIKEKITDFKDKMKSWGKDMLQNFIDGVKDKIQKLKDTFTGILDWIKERFHFSVPDVGPLSDADTWMPDFMDLLASGIDDNKFKVTGAMDSLASDMSLDTGYDGGYESINDTLNIELSIAEKAGAMGALARAILPYLQLAIKEKGAKFA